MDSVKNIIFKDRMPFSQKRDLNKSGIVKLSLVAVIVLVVGLLLMPSEKSTVTNFSEKTDASGAVSSKAGGNDPTSQTIQELRASAASLRSMPDTARSSTGGNQGAGNGTDRNVTMILARNGSDTRNTLTVGARIPIVLAGSLTLASQTMPVTGRVAKDMFAENALAIPEGSQVIGEASFDGSTERANLVWKSIILPDGRERNFSAVSVGGDNQVGVQGNVKSDGLKNTVGQTLTEFIGSYAQGAMSSGMLGASDGGVQNGLKNAVAQTAKTRAAAFGENLKKEHKWIELSAGMGLVAILNEGFVFRDPGATYGK